MLCPRCKAQWDEERRTCRRCGLALRVEPAVAGPGQGPRSLWGEAERPRPGRAGGAVASAEAPELERVHTPGQRETPIPPSLLVTMPASTEPAEGASARNGKGESGRSDGRQPRSAGPVHSPSAQGAVGSAFSGGLKPLRVGELLQGGRYRLSEQQGRHDWLAGAYEIFWQAQDARRGAAPVRICELGIPREDARLKQSLMRSATLALHAAGRHTQIPTLLDAFFDHDRCFFVFEHVEGESLLARLRRRGRPLAEEEVIDCCLQMLDVLDFLASQTPPIVHGLIRPAYIIAGRTRSHYYLTGFSVMLASGATQFIAGIARTQLSPYTAPEFTHGVIDTRSDIYALLASAYHLVTGSPPMRSHGRILPARQLNPGVSARFEAMLARGLYSGQGLRPDLSHRYQYPSQLRQELSERLSAARASVGAASAAPAVVDSLKSGEVASAAAPAAAPAVESASRESEPAASASDTADSLLQNHPAIRSLAPPELLEQTASLLPAPEDLPPLPESNDYRKALLWALTLFLSLAVTIALARGWF
jgi:serine/threonine protein kinase